MSTDNKVILVTGANKGIGFEAVRLLSEKLPSATILLGTRSIPNGETALSKLKSSSTSSYDNIKLIAIDVTDKLTIAAAVEEVKKSYGRLDVLLNNSGISSFEGKWVHPSIFDVNLIGVRDTIEAFLPILSNSSDPTIITVSSEVGSWEVFAAPPALQEQLLNPSTLTWSDIDSLVNFALSPYTPSNPWGEHLKESEGSYGRSKALVSAYMRTVALQHPELKVAVVCPGYCATDLNKNSGTRSAAVGGESVIWPLFNKFKNGHFYQDGIEHKFSQEIPPAFKAHMAAFRAKMKAEAEAAQKGK